MLFDSIDFLALFGVYAGIIFFSINFFCSCSPTFLEEMFVLKITEVMLFRMG